VGVLLFFVGVQAVSAQANPQINYQGKLTDGSGIAVPDGMYNMNFWLIASGTAATSTAVWSESLTGTDRVQVTNGLFSVMLGSSTPLTGVDFNQTLYLGVEIGGTSTPAWDGEMSPRKVLGTVPAAFVANWSAAAGAASSSDEALLLGGVASSSFLRSDEADTMEATSTGSLLTLIQNGAGAVARFFSGVTEVFTILNNGNVGVGTSTPSNKFTVAGNSYLGGNLVATGNVTLATTSASNLYLSQALGASSGGTNLSFVAQDELLIGGPGNTWTQTTISALGLGNGTFLGLTDTPSSYTANRILFTNSGASALTDSADFVFTGTNLGIGSTTPSARLTVQGAAGTANIATFASSTGSTTLALLANGNLELPGQLISAGIEWTTRSAAGNDDSWQSVSYGNGRFVVVGSGSDYVMYSDDGVNWATTTAGESHAWLSVTYGNGLFVAVSNTGTYRVMTSPDGINWTIRASAADTSSWSEVTYGNGIFVAVTCGISSTSCNSTSGNRVMTSPDGINWTSQVSAAETNRWNSVTYGNGLFVAVSSDGTNRVMTSPNGITWTSRSAAAANSWESVTYGNGLFVAVSSDGTNRVMTSPNGITWTARTAAASNLWSSVTYGNGLFVAVSQSGTNNRVMTSPDGITWTSRDSIANSSWQSVTFGNNTFVAVGSSVVSSSGFTAKTELATNNIYQGGTSFMGGLRAGTTSTSVIADIFFQGRAGVNPFAVASSTGTQLLTLDQRGYLGLGSSTPSELLTVAGDTYLGGSLSVSGAFKDSSNASGTAGYVLQTTGSGTQWVATSSLGLPSTFLGLTDTPSSYTANRILFTNSGANAVTDSASFVFTGTNLGLGSTTPSARLTVQGAAGTANIATFASSTGATRLALLANGDLELPGQLISAGIEWDTSTADYFGDSAITYGNGRFVSVGYDGGVSYSDDGVNWATTTITDEWMTGVTYGNGLFVAVGDCFNSGNCIATSVDGETWVLSDSSEDFGIQLGWKSVIYGNGRFVAVGDGNFLNDAEAMYSFDGINWASSTAAGNDDSWQSVTYGNGLFVAVSSSGDRVMTSPDGINWTTRSAAGNNDGWTSVTYGNGLFVAVGRLGDRVMTSPDGINWTTRSVAGDDDDWQSITYGNGLFVAVGDCFYGGDECVMTSPDGITWTARSAAGDNDIWNAVTYGNGMFIARGSGEDGVGPDYVMTSGKTYTSELAHNNIYQGETSFMTQVSIGTTTKNALLTVAGNTYISGNLTALGVTTLANASTTALTLGGALYDTTNSAGAAGMVLQTTGTSTQWVATSSLGFTSGATTFTALTDTPSSYTANRILFTNSGASAVTDSANFTFDGSQLSVNGDVRSGYFTATSTTGTSTFAGRVGIGTTTPGALLSLMGTAGQTSPLFTISSSTGVALLSLSADGSFDLDAGGIYYDAATRQTSIESLNLGAINFADDAGAVSWVDMGVVSSATGTGMSYTAQLDANPVLTIYGESAGSGNVRNLRVGIGSTTPSSRLTVVAENGADPLFTIASTSGSSFLTMTATGNLGLGTTTPGSLLTVAGTANITGATTLGGTLEVADLSTLASLFATNASTTNLSLGGYLYDSTNSAGTVGMVLQTTGTSTQWVATSSLGFTSGATTFTALTDTPSSYTANRILFTNSGANAVTDSASFVFTGTNLGLGSTTPSARLTVQGAAGTANIATFASSTGATRLALLANGDLELPGQLISAGIEWDTSTADYFGDSAITYGNGRFVSVGYDGGVSYSDDGVNWATTTITDEWMTGVTYGNGLFVAVGDCFNSGNCIATSVDGETWVLSDSSEDFGIQLGWKSVIYGNGRFVAVGDGNFLNDAEAMYSFDGINWASSTAAGNDDSWQSVTYGNGLFVAVSSSGDRVMTSPDGINWTTRSAAGNNDGWTSVTYGNGLFVAVGRLGDRVMTSPDGINWTTRSVAGDDDDWQSITYGNGLFVAVGDCFYGGDECVMTSPDGITWTARSAAGDNDIWNAVTYGNGMFIARGSGEDGVGPDYVMTSGKTYTSELAHNNIYQGETSFMTQVSIGTTTKNALLTVAGNTYISGNLTALGVTTLANASTTALTLGGALYDTTNSAGAAGMVLQTTGTSTQWVATSSLGFTSGATTFTALTDTPSSYTANRILFTNSGASAVTDSASFVFDGTNLGIGSTTPSARLTVQGAAGTANIATFASSTGSTTLALLANGNLELGGQLISAGVEWTERSATEANSWTSITYGNGRFVAIAFDGTNRIMTSDDGVSWTAVAAPDQRVWQSVTYGNGLFVAVCSYTDVYAACERTMYSKDGITWATSSPAASGNWYSVTYGNGKFVAVGQSGSSRVMTSSDGINWSLQTAAELNYWYGVTYGNGKFVAVGSLNSGSNVVMTSPDGITWTAQSAAGDDDSWVSVTYGNGLFVAVADSGTDNRVMTSPDGITWTAQSAAGDDDSWVSVTYGNGLFVAVGTGDDYVMTSPDGINWTLRNVVDNGWRAVTYGNGRFVAIAWTGTNRVITSGVTEKTELAHNNIYQGGTSFMGGFQAGTSTAASYASIFLQSEAGKNPFAIASSTGTQLLTLTQTGALGLGTSTPFGAGLTIERTGLSGTTTAGIGQYLTFSNSVAAAQQFGNNTYIRTTNTATTTLLGNFLRIEDSTVLGNTVRGFEVQSDWGTNTLGENTALSGYARTFGVRGITSGDAGGSYEPAGVYGETTGTTQGNALRGYSSTITTASLLKLFQDSSAFTGTGLLMNFGNAGGSFSSTTASKFIDLKNAGTSMFTVGAYGMLTIGDGSTTTNAGIQIGYGGICVDNDGSCTASTTGRITAVEYGTANSDLAENYFTSENIEPGEVVFLKGGLSVGRATKADANKVIGVISTAPGIIMGDNDSSLNAGERAVPVGLKGRVPVRVSNENGEVKAGDELMLSSVPGIVMKASSTGYIIGRALEDYDSSRAYSDTYINQFGENIIVPEYVPINRESDSRIDDGCYYGGGNRTGEEVCVPLMATTSDAQYDEADRLAAEEAKAKALAALARVDSEEIVIDEDTTVEVGQIVMFIDLRYRYLDEDGLTMMAALMATTSEMVDGEEVTGTLWQRLVRLAENFVDGVLSVFTLKADRVETNQLCVDGVCVNAEDLRQLLNVSAPAEQGMSSDGVVVPIPEPIPQPAPIAEPEVSDSVPVPEPGLNDREATTSASTTEEITETVTEGEGTLEPEVIVLEEEGILEADPVVSPQPEPEEIPEPLTEAEPEPIPAPVEIPITEPIE
jgi:hypothetical protein